MFHSKKTWFILSLLAFICAFGAYKIFPQTFPILNINLDMSREEAISNSKNISKNLRLALIVVFGHRHLELMDMLKIL